MNPRDPVEAELAGLVAELGLDADATAKVRAALLRVATAERYEDRGVIGTGAMGEVRRVRDARLRRDLAMKVLHPAHAQNPAVVQRFVAEAQVTAQLAHPGVVPVHAIGELPDGRLYYTMEEVRGRRLGEIVDEVHAASAPTRWRPTMDGWSFARLIDTFHAVCEIVGFAHARGVVHRDLKPDNILVGDFGEVRVVDWGLARVGRAHALAPVTTDRPDDDDPTRTRDGSVAGTPAWMAPEQARGELSRVDARADVYSLGVVLCEILYGRGPWVGTAEEILPKVAYEPARLPTSERPIPDALRDLCARCLSHAREGRPANGRAVAEQVELWRRGEAARERGRREVAQATGLGPEIGALRTRALMHRTEARRLLARAQAWDPVERKRAGWEQEDRAARLDLEADLKEIDLEVRLFGALAQAPDLPEAHRALARHYRDEHRDAEERRDASAAARAEARLRTHVEALPTDDPARESLAAYLRGDGLLTLHTVPADVPARLFRMETVDRRLVPRLVETLGTTPIRHLALPQGSWLVGLRHGGREWTVPVDIGRREHWDNVPPGGGAPVPIVLPDTLAEDECWVPAGWFRSGGDREAAHEEAQVARRVWVDAFVMEKYAVTNARFLAFLDDLVANGREAEALTYVPRERAARPGELGQMIYGRLPNGRFYLRPDADGDPWLPDQPVISVLWSAARAFAAWEAARTGLPWRLPVALEWEKAARGVDGRFFPWGDFLDPSWCCMRDSHAKRPSLATVTAFPEDLSPYGVRGLGGNVSDLCLDGVTPGGPAVLDDRAVVPDPAGPPPAQPYTKGGSWFFGARYARSANLLRRYADVRSSDTGFRLVRSEAVGCRR